MADQPTGNDAAAAVQLTYEYAARLRALREKEVATLQALREQTAAIQALAEQTAAVVKLGPTAPARALFEQTVVQALFEQAAVVQAVLEQATALQALGTHAAMMQALGAQTAVARVLDDKQVAGLRALHQELQGLADLAGQARHAELAAQALTEHAAVVQRLGAELAAFVQQDEVAATDSMPVSIYLADEGIHKQVEKAVEQWLGTADVSIDTRHEPVIGSWFRVMKASFKRAARTPGAREALLTATHVADSRLVQAQDAYVTATLLQNVGPVLQALQPTKDAVVRAGALLIVKVDWVVQVHQLTAAQQAILDHQPHLAASPQEIITALSFPEAVSQEAALQQASTQVSAGSGTN